LFRSNQKTQLQGAGRSSGEATKATRQLIQLKQYLSENVLQVLMFFMTSQCGGVASRQAVQLVVAVPFRDQATRSSYQAS
jgi:hypothetical protein